jgi:hypothetical protein
MAGMANSLYQRDINAYEIRNKWRIDISVQEVSDHRFISPE